MSSRTDIHRPKDLDPSHYEWVGEGDRGKGHWAGGGPEAVWEWDEFPFLDAPVDYEEKAFRGHFVEREGCDHCGANNLRYTQIFKHAPTGEYVTVGIDCADTLSLESLEKKAIIERMERKRVEATQAESLKNTDTKRAVEYIMGDDCKLGGEFHHSLCRRWTKYGNLSERQVAAVIRGIERDVKWSADREAEQANASPVIEGRIEIIGEIISLKTHVNDFGERFVMTVRDERGFKVWGTVPASLDDAERGDRVKFTATTEKSDRDETFGFFKRPAKAEIL